MDYFGQILDDITELWEEIAASPHAADAGPVLKALAAAMRAAARVEIMRAARAEAMRDEMSAGAHRQVA